jgi:hypothetical protein
LISDINQVALNDAASAIRRLGTECPAYPVNVADEAAMREFADATGAISAAISAEQIGKVRAYYEANGASPDAVAHAIVDAVRTGRSLVLVGPYARPMYHLKRLSRSLARSVAINDARKNGYM